MGLGPSLRKLLDKYGEDNVYEIITAFGHRIYLKENRKLETSFPDNQKKMGDYVFNDDLEVLEINLVLNGENKRYFFSYESIEVLSFDNADNPIYDFDALYKSNEVEKTITIESSSFEILKDENITEFKFTGESSFELVNNTWNFFNVYMRIDGELIDLREISTFECIKSRDRGQNKYTFTITAKYDKILDVKNAKDIFVQFYRNGEPINSDYISNESLKEVIDPLTIPIVLG